MGPEVERLPETEPWRWVHSQRVQPPLLDPTHWVLPRGTNMDMNMMGDPNHMAKLITHPKMESTVARHAEPSIRPRPNVVLP